VPAGRLDVLRAGFDAAMKDAQFQAEAARLDLPVIGPISGAEAEKLVASIYVAPPALVTRAQSLVGR
jgi:hypothetical protein